MALLPPAVRRLLGVDPDLVVLSIGTAAVDIGSDRSGTTAELGQIALAQPDVAAEIRDLAAGAHMTGAPVAIRLASDQVLQKDLELPRAAAADLDHVLTFEMEQQTPFRADQVYFDRFVLGPDTTGDKIRVRLLAVPRETVDSAIETVLGFGLVPRWVSFGDDQSGFDRRFNLAPNTATEAAAGVRRDRLLATLAIVLFVVALIIPDLRHDRALADIEARIERLQPVANQALALRQKIDRSLAGAGTVARAKIDAPSAVQMLEELSRRLPDDTWLVQMNMVGDELEIEGTSPSAAALVATLEASPLIASVSFRTPITRDNLTDREQFSLSLRAARP